MEPLTLFPADFPANHSALPDYEKEQMIRATCGQRCVERFEKLPRATSWAKTYAALLIGRTAWYSTRCILTWKLSGTKSRRLWFQLQVSALPISGSGSGSLPTPLATNSQDGKTKQGGQSLISRLLPTPQAIDGDGAGRELRLKPGSRNPEKLGSYRGDLKDLAFLGMLPTPLSNPPRRKLINGEHRSKTTGKKYGISLQQLAQENMLPTPQAGEGGKITGKENQDSITKRVRQITGKTSQLNPRFVAEMMGYPENWTELPYKSGETKASKDMETR